MSNMKRATDVIEQVNAKFVNGTANQQTGPFDMGQGCRRAQLEGVQRKAMRDDVAPKVVNAIVVTNPEGRTVAVEDTRISTRAHASGLWLEDHSEVTVGNCGERSFYAAYLLRENGIKDLTILNGDTGTSINHTFLVLGATDVAARANYSQDQAPAWRGSDIVICEPWFQPKSFSYKCGVAFPLSDWPKWLPKVIDKTLKGQKNEKTQDRKSFLLYVMG